MEVPLLMPGGAAGPWVPSPPDVHQWSPSSSVAASSAGGMARFRRWDPLWAVSVHLGHEKAALHFDISYALCQVPAQAWASALPFAAWAGLGPWLECGEKGLPALGSVNMQKCSAVFIYWMKRICEKSSAFLSLMIIQEPLFYFIFGFSGFLFFLTFFYFNFT